MKKINRIIRQQQKKANKKDNIPHTLNQLFSLDNLISSFFQCRKGVRWKASIQIYQQNFPTELIELRNRLLNKTYKSRGFVQFNIMQRGKKRHIRAVHISERVVQRCLCDYYLIPVIQKYLIYDNGASLKDKGVQFTLQRLYKHLEKAYREWGNDFYVVVFDFSDFFNSINHQILFQKLQQIIPDKDILELTEYFINCFGDRGLGLGSQVSQICAIYYPTSLDKRIKQKEHCKYYGRYMDDGYAIVHTKEEALQIVNTLHEEADALDLTLKPTKIKITKIGHGMTFLKKNIRVIQTGKIIKQLSRKNITSQRRKLKKLGQKVREGKIPFSAIEMSFQSWSSNAKKYDNKLSLHNMTLLYKQLETELKKET